MYRWSTLACFIICHEQEYVLFRKCSTALDSRDYNYWASPTNHRPSFVWSAGSVSFEYVRASWKTNAPLELPEQVKPCLYVLRCLCYHVTSCKLKWRLETVWIKSFRVFGWYTVIGFISRNDFRKHAFKMDWMFKHIPLTLHRPVYTSE